MLAGNTLTSASILYSGRLQSKALNILRFDILATITQKTFFRHQHRSLKPAVSIMEPFGVCRVVILHLRVGPQGGELVLLAAGSNWYDSTFYALSFTASASELSLSADETEQEQLRTLESQLLLVILVCASAISFLF